MSNLSRVLHHQNFSTFDESIFSTQREDSSGVSPKKIY